MNRITFTLILVSLNLYCLSQEFDLIVDNKGDSIVCHIDSITDTHIYFEMKFNNIWIHTNYNRDSVFDYNYDFSYNHEVYFKTGTTIIRKNPPFIIRVLKNPMPKNSVYLSGNIPIGVFINYERKFYPKKGKISYGIQLGYSRDKAYHDGIHESNHYYYTAKTGFLIGRNIHHFEGNFGIIIQDTGDPLLKPTIELGYRFNIAKLMLVRVGSFYWEYSGSLISGLFGIYMGFGINL